MNDSDIAPGQKIENIHWPEFHGHTTVIARVDGWNDDSTVIVELRGPNGVAPLQRNRKLIRDHFKAV